MHEDHIEPVSVVQRKCCVRVLRRCTLNGLGSSLSCASVQGSVRAQRRSGPQVRAVGMCRHHTAPGLHARELVPAVRAVACCCVAALNGKRRVALAAEPRARQACDAKISRMREPCSQGGGASGRDPAALAPVL